MNDMSVHQARPLTDGEQQDVYADALSFYAITQRTYKAFSRLGWYAGAFGVVCITTSMVSWVILLPLKTVEVQFVEVDHATGVIAYGVGPADAPTLFGQKEAEHFLKQYVEKREGYSYETDKRNWDVVQTMSADDVWTEYQAWRKSDLSPMKQLGRTGHVTVTDFAFTPHDQKNGTFEYTVRYTRQEVRGDNIGPRKSLSNTIDFQWHPKASMTTQEGQDNPGGMLVLVYTPPEIDR